jgi:predicted nucleotidyltransferase
MSSTDANLSLAAALFPKARRAVLGLLFGQPDRAFYLRQIVELTGLGVGHVQRELGRLTDAGVIVRTEQGRHVYFQANERCPIHDELRGIVTKTIGAAAVLRDALTPLAGRITVAFIYGSIARQQEKQGSDIDLMVVGDVAFAEIVDAVRAAEDQLGRPVNPTVFPLGEFAAKLSAGHHFLSAVMAGAKVFVLGDADELADVLEQRLGP